MITTHFKKLMAVVICLLAGMTAQAQLTATYEPYAATDWGNEKTVDFKLTDVAQALETDTATLVAALNSWTAEGSTDANMFFLTVADSLNANYTQGSKGGFWVNADGLPEAWSGDTSGLRWFNMISWASAENEDGKFSVIIGQFPGQCAVGNTFKPKFVLKLGEKEATIEITINIIEKPVVDIPEPELEWGKLTIVEEITKDVTQKYRAGAEKVEVDLTEALSKLGISASAVQDELRQLLFAKIAYVTEDAVLGAQMSDSLTNESSANGIGFWLRNFSDAEGNPSNECGRFVWGGDDSFYAEYFSFDAETGILSCYIGQMSDNLKAGNTYYAYIYLVYGDKAIKIRYNLILPEVKIGTLEDYEKAGENTIKVEMEPKTSGDYSTKDFSIDIEEITTKLGCAVGEIDDFYMLDGEIEFVTGKNQEGVGYWVSMEGKVVSWGENAMFYVTPKADDYSKFGIGQYPDHMNEGDSARATLYFVAGSKYYQLNIDLVIVAAKQVDVVFESVAQRSIEVQQVPVEYIWTSGVEIPAEWVEQQIGTSDWALYALAPLNDDGSEKEGNARYSKQYTCTPYPGFWMDGEGHNIGWNSNARVGATIASPEGSFALMQYPGVALGEVFNFPLFLVNEENGKMVTFNFTYSIVESVVEIQEVGSENIVLPVSDDDDGASATIDLSGVLKAYDITLDALANGKYLHGITADGTYGSGVSLYDGLAFTDKGVCVTEDPFIFFEAEVNEDGKSITITSYANDVLADDFSAMGTMCFLVDGKRYVFNVRFVSETVYTGITEHHSVPHTSLSAVYDLQGRKVVKTQRGLYIQNGRKYMVK